MIELSLPVVGKRLENMKNQAVSLALTSQPTMANVNLENAVTESASGTSDELSFTVRNSCDIYM